MEPTERQADGAGTSKPIIRPPLLFIAALLLGLIADRLLPWPVTLPGATLVHWIVGGVLAVVGLAIATAGIRNFSGAGTPVRSVDPTRALVMSGIHGRSRNPIYVGMFLIYGGIGLAAQSPWMLALLPPLAVTMRYGVVAREEAYLERLFGDAYRDYKMRVRRWL